MTLLLSIPLNEIQGKSSKVPLFGGRRANGICCWPSSDREQAFSWRSYVLGSMSGGMDIFICVSVLGISVPPSEC